MRDTEVNYRDIERQAYRDVLTGHVGREVREVIEGLVVVVLLAVGVVCGMVIENRWSAVETRVETFERRVQNIENLYGPIGEEQ